MACAARCLDSSDLLALTPLQVTHVLVEGPGGRQHRLPASLVIVGVGARPNIELFTGQLELALPPVGGIKVRLRSFLGHK